LSQQGVVVMVTAAKKTSQVATHMGIAFALAYAMTGSAVLGGLAILLEPVINVILLPFHEKAWAGWRRKAVSGRERFVALAGEKASQTILHAAVAFAVMYWATGSAAYGGIAALLEPVCNVAILPAHDRFWENLRARLKQQTAVSPNKFAAGSA
jgi:uncharacterized membrane protein